MSSTASAPLQFGATIENDLKEVWTDIETFGEQALAEGEDLAENEVSAISTAATGLLGTFLPAQIANIKTWVDEFVKEIGDGEVTGEAAVTAILNKDSASEGSFLNSVGSAALSALVSAFLAAL